MRACVRTCVCLCTSITVIGSLVCVIRFSWTTKLVQLMLAAPPNLILIGYWRTGWEKRSAGEDPQALPVEPVRRISHSLVGLRSRSAPGSKKTRLDSFQDYAEEARDTLTKVKMGSQLAKLKDRDHLIPTSVFVDQLPERR